MDYLEYEVADFLLDSSFRNYCLGTNAQDLAFWEQWVVLHPEKYDLIKEARQLYFVLNGNIGPGDVGQALKQFRARFEEHEAVGNDLKPEGAPFLSLAPTDDGKRSRPLPASRYWIAAAVLVPLILSAAIIWQRRGLALSRALSAATAIVSKHGERKSFQLADGTNVVLNAGSMLRAPDDFNQTTREITLVGEAFFDVAKDPHKIFVIHTSLVDIKVLGTSLNVKEYTEELESETSLLTGSVEVQVKGKDRVVVLRPGEKIVVRNANLSVAGRPLTSSLPPDTDVRPYRIERMSVDPGDSSLAEVSWIRNKLVFNDDSFGEMATALERYYNVSISFDDAEVKAYRFTASFENKSLDQVLEALAASRPFIYRKEPGNKIKINSSNMTN